MTMTIIINAFIAAADLYSRNIQAGIYLPKVKN